MNAKIIAIIISALSLISTKVSGANDCAPEGIDICKMAREVSDSIAPSLPMQLNSNLTIQTIFAFQNVIVLTAFLKYDSSLLQRMLDENKMSMVELTQKMNDMAKGGMCKPKSTTIAFIQMGGVIRYVYKFFNGEEFLTVNITGCPLPTTSFPAQGSQTQSEQPDLSSMTRDQAKIYFADKCKREGNCYPQGTFGESAKASCKKLITEVEEKSLRLAFPSLGYITLNKKFEDFAIYEPRDTKYGRSIAVVETVNDIEIDGHIVMQLRHQCHINNQLKILGVARVKALPGAMQLNLSYRKNGPDPIKKRSSDETP
jgi:hypothetical protein